MNSLYCLKNSLPLSMRVNAKWSFFADKCDELVSEFIEGYIKPIYNSFNIFSEDLNDLKDICSNIFLLNEKEIDRVYLFLIEEGYSNDEIIRMLQNELFKYAYMIQNRGTLKFYNMLQTFFIYTYPIKISLVKQGDQTCNTSKCSFHFDLAKHAEGSSKTEIVSSVLDEDYLAYEPIDSQLDLFVDDALIETKLKLDLDNNGVNTLDLKSDREDTAFKRNLFIGLELNKDNFNTNKLFPKDIGFYLMSILKLYKKATENIIFSFISSMHIVESGEIENIASIYNYDIKYDENKDLIVEYINDSNDILYSTKPNSINYTEGQLKLISLYEGNRLRTIDISSSNNTPKLVSFNLENIDNIENYNLHRFIKVIDNVGRYLIFKESEIEDKFEVDDSNDSRFYDSNGKLNVSIQYNNLQINIYSDLNDVDLSEYKTMTLSCYQFDTNIKTINIKQGEDILVKIDYKKPIDVIQGMYLMNILTVENK